MPRGQKKLRLLFITDPLENFDLKAETTLYLMEEAQRRGHGVFYCRIEQLNARGSQIWVKAQELKLSSRSQRPWYQIRSQKLRLATYFDAILLRKDPPFDLNYLQHLYLLELISHQVYCMNHPPGILLGNEKLLPLKFPELIPETMVSASKEELLAFLKSHPQGMVLKPIGEAGGRGVFLLKRGMENIQVILEMATRYFSQAVIAQSYLPEAKRGDKRILLLGSEVLGSFVRKPASGEHRANLHVGGQAKAGKITARENKIIEQILPTLQKMGLDFVGLDVIAGRLIEINLTSPMGIHEINQTAKIKSERRVLDFIEAKVH